MGIERDATKHGIALTPIEIDALLNSAEKDDVVESFTTKEQGRPTAGVKYVIMDESEKDKPLEKGGLYTLEDELKGSAVSNAYFKPY